MEPSRRGEGLGKYPARLFGVPRFTRVLKSKASYLAPSTPRPPRKKGGRTTEDRRLQPESHGPKETKKAKKSALTPRHEDTKGNETERRPELCGSVAPCETRIVRTPDGRRNSYVIASGARQSSFSTTEGPPRPLAANQNQLSTDFADWHRFQRTSKEQEGQTTDCRGASLFPVLLSESAKICVICGFSNSL
jgi:hypothetical protein